MQSTSPSGSTLSGFILITHDIQIGKHWWVIIFYVVSNFHEHFHVPPQSRCIVMWAPVHFSCTGCHCCITSESSCSTLHFQRLQQHRLKGASHSTGTQRTVSLNMSADSSNGSHPTWNLESQKPIWLNPAGVCARHVFQFIKTNFNISIRHACCSARLGVVRCRGRGTVCSRLRQKKSTIKDCYSKIYFL